MPSKKMRRGKFKRGTLGKDLIKRIIVFLGLILVAVTLFPGCWDLQETDQLALVGSIALDKHSRHKVLVSMEILNPGALARGLEQGTGIDNVVGWVVREEATTVSNAIMNAQRRVPQDIFLGQVNTIILGQNYAREGGVARHLEYFAARSEVRRSVTLATCDSANNLLQRPFMEELPSLTLGGLMDKAVASGKTVRVTINEFLMKLAEPGIEPITMHAAGRETKDIKILPQGKDVRQENPAQPPRLPLESEINVPAMFPPDSPVLDPLREAGTGEPIEDLTPALGIGVFKGDRLVGFLDGNDARGYLWAVGRMPRGGFLEIPDPFNDREGSALGLKVVRLRSAIKPVITDDSLSMAVEVRVELELLEAPINIYTGQREVIKEIEGRVNRFIQEEIRANLRRVQEEFESDIYGFGQALYRKAPQLWWELSPGWNDESFPRLDVEISVESRVRSSGAIVRQRR